MKEKFPDATDNSLIRYLMAKEYLKSDSDGNCRMLVTLTRSY
jgi:hypothetical protein